MAYNWNVTLPYDSGYGSLSLANEEAGSPGRSMEKCGKCHKDIDPAEESLGRMTMTIDGAEAPVHADCYYDALGELVEQHPIGVVRNRPLHR